jgi:hypothetical protein
MSLCVPPFELVNQLNDFHETWHEHYDIKVYANAVFYNFLQSAIGL